MRTVRLLLALAVLDGTVFNVLALSVADYAVQVSATVQTNPPLITLSWPADASATDYSLFRKGRDETAWGPATTLATNATGWVDSNVVEGVAYEYRIKKTGLGYTGYGYIYAGIKVPLVESRGKVVLLVDNTQAGSLTMELARLVQDLVGDGWIVLRHDVSRTDSVTNIKSLIIADYNADPANVKAVFALGHVPVPYSGNLAPDGHAPHQGAWPADVYYGDVDGVWTDSSVTKITADDPRNRNVPGDGKFDQTSLPSSLEPGVGRVELGVGRVDLANLPAFPQSESQLLRQYLNKDHRFRHRLIVAERRGLIDDNTGINAGEEFAVNGWRNFAPLFGASNTVAGDWLTTLATDSYLWGYGCGAGTYSSASGVGTTSQFAASDPRVVFTMLIGSYFGDWDTQDNFLRAPLATTNYTLTCAWAGRPNWQFHHMALGEPIGFCSRLSQNNSTTYDPGGFWRYVHIALMGDPTLRLHPVTPPSALVVTTNGSGGMELRWDASPDNVIGYHVYRAPTASGPFTRQNGILILGTNYTAPVVSADIYMVRAVKLELAGSGSYYNLSQGIFQNLTGTVGVPAVALIQPTNNATFDLGANIPMVASVFDPSNSITRVEYYANGLKIGEATGLAYSLTWSNVPPTNCSLTVSAFSGATPVANSGPVAILVGSVFPKLTITALGGGLYGIGGSGFPGYTYQVQFADVLPQTNWQTLGVVTANAFGGFQFTNSNDSTQRFFRTVYP